MTFESNISRDVRTSYHSINRSSYYKFHAYTIHYKVCLRTMQYAATIICAQYDSRTDFSNAINLIKFLSYSTLLTGHKIAPIDNLCLRKFDMSVDEALGTIWFQNLRNKLKTTFICMWPKFVHTIHKILTSCFLLQTRQNIVITDFRFTWWDSLSSWQRRQAYCLLQQGVWNRFI